MSPAFLCFTHRTQTLPEGPNLSNTKMVSTTVPDCNQRWHITLKTFAYEKNQQCWVQTTNKQGNKQINEYPHTNPNQTKCKSKLIKKENFLNCVIILDAFEHCNIKPYPFLVVESISLIYCLTRFTVKLLTQGGNHE